MSFEPLKSGSSQSMMNLNILSPTTPLLGYARKVETENRTKKLKKKRTEEPGEQKKI